MVSLKKSCLVLVLSVSSFAQAVVIELQNNLADILAKHEFVVIDFYKNGCPPCTYMLSILNQVAEKVPGVAIVKVNVSNSGLIAEAKRIDSGIAVSSVPTFVFFQNGVRTHIVKGSQNPDTKQRWTSQSFADYIKHIFGA